MNKRPPTKLQMYMFTVTVFIMEGSREIGQFYKWNISSQNAVNFMYLQQESFIKPNHLLKQRDFILLEFINIFLENYFNYL